MWNRLLALFVLVPAIASAQTVAADRIRLNTGPCIERSGSGTPEGAVTGNVCDSFHRTDTGALYLKASGSGNTGWQQFGLTLDTPGSTNLTIAPTGDLVLGPAGTDILPNTGYTHNIGALTNKFLTLHAAELWVETLVAQNTIATIGGRILVAPTNILTSDVATIASVISVKYNNFASGDRVYLEADGKVEFMAVTSGSSGSGPYTYSVTRNLDGSGTNLWYAGDAIVDTGTTGNGFLDVYSTAGVLSVGTGPTIVGNVRTGTAYNAYSPRWAIGNLNGLFGYASSIYGAVFGNPAATNVTVDATNGFRIRSSTTNKFLADTTGNLSIVGDLTVGTSGTIHSAGATAFGTGTGFWLAGGATPVFRVGDPAGAGLSWDGTTLSIRSSGAAGGKNLIRNAECRVGTDDWTVGFNNTGISATLGSALSMSFELNGVPNTCYLTLPGTPAVGTQAQIYLNQFTRFPVAAGSRYEASAYLGNVNTATSQVVINWYDSAGAFISVSSGSTCAPAAGGGGTTLAGYCRSTLVANAPALATTAFYYINAVYPGALANPYVFLVRAYFGEAGPYQTEASAWGAAGTTEITGGTIKTGSVNADRIIANTITAGQISAGTITATEIAANTITAAKIAAGTITATEIAANTITAAKIAAGTITATEIAANTITAGKLNVSSLSAISADLGTVTAGTINGITINGVSFNGGDINIGSGNFVVDTFGIVSVLNLTSTGQIQITAQGGAGSNYACFDSSGVLYRSTAC